MLPLSFKEFIDFHGYTLKETRTPVGTLRRQVMDESGEVFELQDMFDAYMKFGGMPGIADVGFEQDKVIPLLDGVYSTVIVRDILERERRRGQRQIADAELLRKIVLFLADNIGNNTSLNSISNTLISEKLLEYREKRANRQYRQYLLMWLLCWSPIFSMKSSGLISKEKTI